MSTPKIPNALGWWWIAPTYGQEPVPVYVRHAKNLAAGLYFEPNMGTENGSLSGFVNSTEASRWLGPVPKPGQESEAVKALIEIGSWADNALAHHNDVDAQDLKEICDRALGEKEAQ